MGEQESLEVFLTMSERLDLMRASLRRVIETAANEDLDLGAREIIIDMELEDFFVHAEAAGASLNLNARERTVLGTILQKGKTNPELVAQKCAQFLGALNHDARYPIAWKDQPLVVKSVFLSELDEILDKLLNGEGCLDDLYYLEELISGFICHEEYNFDPKIQKLCFEIEECIREAFRPEGRVDFVRLRIKRCAVGAMKESLNITLS